MINLNRFNGNNSGKIQMQGAYRNPYTYNDLAVVEFSGIGSVYLSTVNAYQYELLFLYDEQNNPSIKIGSSIVNSEETPPTPIMADVTNTPINLLNLVNAYTEYFVDFGQQVTDFITEHPSYKAFSLILQPSGIIQTVANNGQWFMRLINESDILYVSEVEQNWFYGKGGFNLVNIPMSNVQWSQNGNSVSIEGGIKPSDILAEILDGNAEFEKELEDNGHAVNDSLFYVPWIVYLDGSIAPNISVQIAVPENEVFEKYYNNMNCTFNYLVTTDPDPIHDTLATVPLLQMGYNTSFNDIMKIGSPSLFQKLIGIGQKLWSYIIPDVYKIQLNMFLSYIDDENTTHFTDTCYINIPYRVNSIADVETGKKSKRDKSTIEVKLGYPDEDDLEDFYPFDMGDTDDPSDPSDPVDDFDNGYNTSYNTVSVLTTTYGMTESRLKQLGTRLWDSDFLDNIQMLNNSPIENILSCKAFPFNITGTDTSIILGNVDMGVNGVKVGRDYNYRRTIGTFKIEKKYNSFLDYEPYTSINIYLPFIGYKELTPSVFMDKTIKVDYIIDLVTGTCKAIIYANNIQQIDFDGSCGIDIPITSSNRAQVEVGYVTSALGVVTDVANVNPMGAVHDLINSSMIQNHSNTSGTASPSCSAYTSKDIFIIYNRPTWQDLKTFNHVHGRMCNLSKNLKSLKGFTICNKQTDLSHLTCTMKEKEIIRNIITSGVIL